MRISDWSSDVCSSDLVLSLWPQVNGIVQMVATVPASDGRWQRVERWVARSSRALVPCYLNEDDFLGVGESLGTIGAVEVSKLTWRDGLQSHAVGYRANRPSLAEAVFRDVPNSGQVRTALRRARSEERRVGKECVRTCRSRGSPYN